MDHDYYAILGVDETADRATIWEAYRRLAYQRHPDRGGTHAEMVLLNRAWEMLGDAESRRRYDRLRQAPTDPAAQSECRRDEAAAQERAEKYPTDWSALEQWWQSAAGEITGARYGRWPWDFESVHGRSLQIFIGIGGMLGFVLGIWLAANIDYPKSGKAALHRLVGAVGIPTFIGMIAGKVVHYLISTVLRLAGVGNSLHNVGLTKDELRRMGLFAVVGLAALLLITDNSEPRLVMGMTRAAVQTAFEEHAFDKLQSGFMRGGLVGAAACFLLAQYELARNATLVRREKLPEYFPYRAALYGGLAFAVIGFTFELLSIPKSSGTVVFWRLTAGAVAGAAASALTLFTVKLTGVPDPAVAENTQDSAPESVIVACTHCGKKLRIPRHSEELLVTCPVCQGEFTYGGPDAASAR